MFFRIPTDRNNNSVFITFDNDKRILFYTGEEEIPDSVLLVIPFKESEGLKENYEEFLMKVSGKYVGNLEFYGDINFVRDFYQKTKYKNIVKVHYVKPKELQRYNSYTLYKRLWRAVVERSVEVIVLPHSELSQEALKLFNNFFIVSSRIPGPDDVNWNNSLFSILLGIFVSLQMPVAIFSFLLFNTRWLFVTVVSILGSIACYYSTKNNFTKLISFFILGALTNFSLYSFTYLNDIEVYRGVKASLLILPITILTSIIASYVKALKDFKKEHKTRVKGSFFTKYEIFLFTLLSIIALSYLIIRSGNYGFVTAFEEKLRLTLENIFIIRPRLKELAFIPVLLISSEFTKKNLKFVAQFLGSFALISIFNSFCHIKTPIFVVFYRETVTIIVGIVIYTIIYILIKLINIWTGKV